MNLIDKLRDQHGVSQEDSLRNAYNTLDDADPMEQAGAAAVISSAFGIPSHDGSVYNGGAPMEPSKFLQRMRDFVDQGTAAIESPSLREWNELGEDREKKVAKARGDRQFWDQVADAAGRIVRSPYAASPGQPDEITQAQQRLKRRQEAIHSRDTPFQELAFLNSYKAEDEDRDRQAVDEFGARDDEDRIVADYESKLLSENVWYQYKAVKGRLSAEADAVVQNAFRTKKLAASDVDAFKALPFEQQRLVASLAKNVQDVGSDPVLVAAGKAFAKMLVDVPVKAVDATVVDGVRRAVMDDDDYQRQAQTRALLAEATADMAKDCGYWYNAAVGAAANIPYMVYASAGGAGLVAVAASTARDFENRVASEGGDVASPGFGAAKWAVGFASALVERLPGQRFRRSMTDIERRTAFMHILRRANAKVVAGTLGVEWFNETKEEAVQAAMEEGFVAWGTKRDIPEAAMRAAVKEAYAAAGTMLITTMAGGGGRVAAANATSSLTTGELLSGALHAESLWQAQKAGDKGTMRQHMLALAPVARLWTRAGTSGRFVAELKRRGISESAAAQYDSFMQGMRRIAMTDDAITAQDRADVFGRESSAVDVLGGIMPRALVSENPDGSFVVTLEVDGKATSTTLAFSALGYDPNDPAAATSIAMAINGADPAAEMTAGKWLAMAPEERLALSSIYGLHREGNFELTAPDGTTLAEPQAAALTGRIDVSDVARTSAVLHESLHAVAAYLRTMGVLSESDVARLREEFGDPQAGTTELFNEEAAADAFREWSAGRVRFAPGTVMDRIADAVGGMLRAATSFRRRKEAARTVRDLMFEQIAAGTWTGIPVGTVSQSELDAKEKAKPEKPAKKHRERPRSAGKADAGDRKPRPAPAPSRAQPAPSAPAPGGINLDSVRRKDDAEEAKKAAAIPPTVGVPVLARRLDAMPDGTDLQKVAELSNRPAILSRTPAEQAEGDAKTVASKGLLGLWNPGQDGDVLAASNADFMAAFVRATGDDSLVDSEGRPTDEAARRVRRAMLAVVAGSGDDARSVVRSLVEEAKDLGMSREVAGVMRAAGALADSADVRPDFSLLPDMARALRDYIQWRREGGLDVGNWLAQQDMFEDRPEAAAAIVRAMAERRTVGGISAMLADYAQRARTALAEPDLFGNPPPTKLELLDQAIKSTADAAASAAQEEGKEPDAPPAKTGNVPPATGNVPRGTPPTSVPIRRETGIGSRYSIAAQSRPGLTGDPGDDSNRVFGSWESTAVDRLRGFRGLSGYFKDRNKITPYGGTEGHGIYVSKDESLAGFFGKPLPILFDQPRRPLVLGKADALHLLNEGESLGPEPEAVLSAPETDADSDWLKAHKRAYAAAPERWWDSEEYQAALTQAVLDMGYDAVYCGADGTQGGDEWVVLLRDQKAEVEGTGMRYSIAAETDPMGFYSQLRAVLAEKMPSRQSVRDLRNLTDPQKGTGIKADELEWSGFSAWLDSLPEDAVVTKQQALEAARDFRLEEAVLGGTRIDGFTPEDRRRLHHLQTNEIVLSADERAEMRDLERRAGLEGTGLMVRRDEDAETKFDQYTLPGRDPGTYAERLVTVPNSSTEPDPDSIREEFDLLLHIRHADRTTADGKALLVEEVQRDWHQQGREKGYVGETAPPGYEVRRKEYDGLYQLFSTEDGGTLGGAYETEREVLAARIPGMSGRVPAAPFSDTSKGWARLAMKRVFRLAAERGISRVLWITGRTQIERYEDSMRQAVDEMEWKREDLSQTTRRASIYDIAWAEYNAAFDTLDAGQQQAVKDAHFKRTRPNVLTVRKGKSVVLRAEYDANGVITDGSLGGSTGKPLSDLIGKDAARKVMAEPSGTLKGDDLHIGGEGMLEFYDRILVRIANDLGKKYGAKAVDATMPHDGSMGDTSRATTPAQAEAALRKSEQMEAQGVKVHAFDIPEAMRADILRGQARFSIVSERMEGPTADAQAQGTSGAQRYSFAATRPKVSGSSAAAASLTVMRLMGREPTREDAERHMRLFRADGTTSDALLADSKRFADGAVGDAARAALATDDPSKAATVVARNAEFESIAAAREGAKTGAKLGYTAARAEDRAVVEAIKQAQGTDLTALVVDTGADLTATLLDILPETFAPGQKKEPDAPDAEDEGDDDGTGAGKPEPEATPEQLEDRAVRCSNLLEIVKAWHDQYQARKAKRAADRKAAEDARRQKLVDEGKDPDAEPDNTEDEAEDDSEQPIAAIPKELLEAARVDLRSAMEFSHFMRLWTGDYIVRRSDGQLTPQTVWRDRESVERYRKTMQAQLRQMAAGLLDPTDHSPRIVAEMIGDIPSTSNAFEVERRTSAILKFIQRNAIRQSRHKLVKDLAKTIRERAAKGSKFDPMEEDLQRKVKGESEKLARALARYVGMTQKQVDKERERLSGIIEGRAAMYGGLDPEGHPIDVDVATDMEYHYATVELAMLNRWGGLRQLLPGEIVAMGNEIAEWLDTEQERLRERWFAVAQDNAAKATAFLNGIVPEDVDTPRPRPDALDNLADSLISTVRQRLTDAVKLAPDEEARRAALDVVEDVMYLLSRGTERYNSITQRYRDAWYDAIKAINGKANVKAYMDHLHEPIPEEVSREISRQGYAGTMTYGQAMQLYASITQEFYDRNVAEHGRGAHADMIAAVLTPEDMALVARLRSMYEDRRQELSEAVEAVTGVPVWRPDALYMPVRMKQRPTGGLRSHYANAWSALASTLTPRQRNLLDFDEGATIQSIFHERAKDAAAAIAYGEAGIRIRGIIGRPDVKEALERYHGKAKAGALYRQVEETLMGDRVRDMEPQSRILRAAMTVNTYTLLSWNVVSSLKQVVSLPAWALVLDGGFKDIGAAIKAVSQDRTLVREFADSDGFRSRYQGGMIREIHDIIANPAHNWLSKFYRLGMQGVQYGDMVSSVIVGAGLYKAKREAYIDQGMDPAEAADRAKTVAWALVEESMQSGRTENQPGFLRQQGGGGMAWRALFQFGSSPMQQLSHEIQAIREWKAGVPGAREKAVRAIVINHMIITFLMETVATLFGMLLGDEPPESEEALTRYVYEVMMGPFARILVIGALARGLYNGFADGKRIYGSDYLPIAHLDRIASTVGVTANDIVNMRTDDLLKDIGDLARDTSAPGRHIMKAVRNYRDEE